MTFPTTRVIKFLVTLCGPLPPWRPVFTASALYGEVRASEPGNKDPSLWWGALGGYIKVEDQTMKSMKCEVLLLTLRLHLAPQPCISAKKIFWNQYCYHLTKLQHCVLKMSHKSAPGLTCWRTQLCLKQVSGTQRAQPCGSYTSRIDKSWATLKTKIVNNISKTGSHELIPPHSGPGCRSPSLRWTERRRTHTGLQESSMSHPQRSGAQKGKRSVHFTDVFLLSHPTKLLVSSPNIGLPHIRQCV